MKERTGRFGATLENLEPITAFISTFMQEVRLCQEQIHNFAIAVDEHFTNLVEHAFYGNSGEEITITCRVDRTKAQLIITDASAGFDPRNYTPPQDVERTPIAEITPGGLGNYFICELMDDVEYIHRPHVKNTLILTIYTDKDQTKRNFDNSNQGGSYGSAGSSF